MDDSLLDDILNNMAKKEKFQHSERYAKVRHSVIGVLPERKRNKSWLKTGLSAAVLLIAFTGVALLAATLVREIWGHPAKYSAKQKTFEHKRDELVSPPELRVSSGDSSISAVLGTYSWTRDNGDGTKTTTNADSAAPPDLVKGRKILVWGPSTLIRLEFGLEPKILEGKIWGSNSWSTLNNNTIKFPNILGNVIYEIHAQWEEGDAYYAFEVSTVPSEAKERK